MSDLALFAIGVAVTVPAAIVVVILVYAAGIDARAEKKHQVQLELDTRPPA